MPEIITTLGGLWSGQAAGRDSVAARAELRAASRRKQASHWLWVTCIALATFFAGSVNIRGENPPSLPDPDAFIAQVRARLRTDEELQSHYTYLEKRQQIRLGKLGKVYIGDIRLFEVYPSSIPGQTYRRLVAVNGVPIDPDVVRSRDEARQKLLADREMIRSRETPLERVSRERNEAGARKRRQEIAGDVFRVYDIRPVGREFVDGHRVIIATLTPRTGVPTRSAPAKYFAKLRGRAWVNEDDYEVIKVELIALRDILVGWGIVGRIHEGSRVMFERRKVNDEVWLPARTSIELAGRTLLVRKFRVQAVTEFSDYKKFTVTTTETYKPSPN